MAFRFQKRISILPGVRINLSKSGASASLGPRGADVNIGRDGVTANAGIPGTGLSYREKLGGAASGRRGKTGWLGILAVMGGPGVLGFPARRQDREGRRAPSGEYGFIHHFVHKTIHRCGVNFACARQHRRQHAALCASERLDSAGRTKGFWRYPQKRTQRRPGNPCF